MTASFKTTSRSSLYSDETHALIIYVLAIQREHI